MPKVRVDDGEVMWGVMNMKKKTFLIGSYGKQVFDTEEQAREVKETMSIGGNVEVVRIEVV